MTSPSNRAVKSVSNLNSLSALPKLSTDRRSMHDGLINHADYKHRCSGEGVGRRAAISSIESGRPLERGSENAISTLRDLAVLPGNHQTDRRHGH